MAANAMKRIRRFHSKSRISYAGWGGRIRTCACRYQKPVPYRLATPQHVRPSRIEEASLYSSRACGKGLFCSFPAENISWIDSSPDRYNLSAIAGSGHRLRNFREIGRAHVGNQVTNAHTVCRPQIEQKNNK